MTETLRSGIALVPALAAFCAFTPATFHTLALAAAREIAVSREAIRLVDGAPR